MSGRLSGRRIAMPAADGVDRDQLLRLREALEAQDAHVELVARRLGEVRTVEDLEEAGTVPVDVALMDAEPSRYDALVLAGGVAGADHLRLDRDAVALTRDFVDARKPIAAVGHAPWLLVDADAVRGRRIASWPSLRIDLVNAGAEWADEEVCVDGTVLTGRGATGLDKFCARLVELLAAG